ncbi:MAG: hypothetical protein WD845_01045 [Pirellulales bacterium]
MFRVRDWDAPPVGVVAGRAIVVIVLVASTVSIVSLALVVREHYLLGVVSGGIQDGALRSLRREVALQILFAVIIAGTLVACAVAVSWLRRRYMSAHSGQYFADRTLPNATIAYLVSCRKENFFLGKMGHGRRVRCLSSRLQSDQALT